MSEATERLLAFIAKIESIDESNFGDYEQSKLRRAKELLSLLQVAERRAFIEARRASEKAMEKEFKQIPSHIREEFDIEFDQDNGDWDFILEY